MQLNQFQVHNETSFSSRSGNALISLDIAHESFPATQILDYQKPEAPAVSGNDFRFGSLSIHERGDLIHSWAVKITPGGAVFCQDDDFYIALEFFATLQVLPAITTEGGA